MRNEYMINALTSLLEKQETLKAPFYGTITKIGGKYQNPPLYSYLGRTNTDLLIAVINPYHTEKIEWSTRIPLDIKQAIIKKSLLPNQYVITLLFQEGNGCTIRISTKIIGGKLVDQEENVLNFLNFLNRFTNKNI